jgi:serine/threonine protein kinase
VRIARQVPHPNVCRVYDIGFIEGFHFLSMEYLDGEDLASLIRRIGPRRTKQSSSRARSVPDSPRPTNVASCTAI